MPLLPQEEALARAQALVDKSTAAETEVTIDSVEDRFGLLLLSQRSAVGGRLSVAQSRSRPGQRIR